jgi:hypothetical protein
MVALVSFVFTTIKEEQTEDKVNRKKNDFIKTRAIKTP